MVLLSISQFLKIVKRVKYNLLINNTTLISYGYNGISFEKCAAASDNQLLTLGVYKYVNSLMCSTFN